jgi:hypothetical protein
MKMKAPKVLELQSELVRLTKLVRERRSQLDRLKDCPNAACPCRAVWREHVEKKLSGQVRKIRKSVRETPSPSVRNSPSKKKTAAETART